MNRFVIQEMKISGFTHYEIIDTENECKTVYTSRDYMKVIGELVKLRTLEKISIGDCVHIDYYATKSICSEKEAHQNFRCPYKDNYGKCKCYIPITETMRNQLETKGYFTHPIPDYWYKSNI